MTTKLSCLALGDHLLKPKLEVIAFVVKPVWGVEWEESVKLGGVS